MKGKGCGVPGLLCLLLAAVTWPVQAQTVVKYYHTDALGSVVAVTDANGNVIERREYEPYGAQLTPAVQDGPGYTGHVQDAATGLVYMQQRYYDPQLGVFLSVDPVTAYEGPVDQFHRYRYANNNPYKFVDPDGQQAFGSADPAKDYRRDPNGRTAVMLLCGGCDPNSQAPPGSGAVESVFTPIEAAGASGIARGIGAVAAKEVSTKVSALTRAKEIHGALKPGTQGRVTTAVAETKEGVRVVGSSEGSLRPAQRAALQSGEVAAKGARGTHAEINAVNGARAQGLNPTSVSPSRPACAGCQETMRKLDIPIIDR